MVITFKSWKMKDETIIKHWSWKESQYHPVQGWPIKSLTGGGGKEAGIPPGRCRKECCDSLAVSALDSCRSSSPLGEPLGNADPPGTLNHCWNPPVTSDFSHSPQRRQHLETKILKAYLCWSLSQLSQAVLVNLKSQSIFPMIQCLFLRRNLFYNPHFILFLSFF